MISRNSVERVVRLVEQSTGVRIPTVALPNVESTLGRTFKTESDLQYLLQGEQDDAVRQLAESLLIHCTWFYRESKRLSQTLQRIKQPGAELRIWCAGCSTGEEPYTVAMVALDLGYNVDILATDVSDRVLDIAQTGFYPKRAEHPVPKRVAEKYFVEDQGRISPIKAVRERVTFKKHNLLELTPPTRPPFDLIICRNVLMYFSSARARQIISRFSSWLAPAGETLLGSAEVPIFSDEFRRKRKDIGEKSPILPNKVSSGDVATTATKKPETFRLDKKRELDLRDAEQLANMGYVQSAIELLDALVKDSPFAPPLLLNLGIYQKRAGEIQDAERSFRAARFLQPDAWMAPYKLAQCIEELGDGLSAVDEYRYALGLIEVGRDSGLLEEVDEDLIRSSAEQVCRDKLAEIMLA